MSKDYLSVSLISEYKYKYSEYKSVRSLVSEGYLSVSLIRPHGNSPEVWIVWILMVIVMMVVVITIKRVW